MFHIRKENQSFNIQVSLFRQICQSHDNQIARPNKFLSPLASKLVVECVPYNLVCQKVASLTSIYVFVFFNSKKITIFFNFKANFEQFSNILWLELKFFNLCSLNCKAEKIQEFAGRILSI